MATENMNVICDGMKNLVAEGNEAIAKGDRALRSLAKACKAGKHAAKTCETLIGDIKNTLHGLRDEQSATLETIQRDCL